MNEEVDSLMSDKDSNMLLTWKVKNFLSQEQIAYLLTQKAVHLLFYFKDSETQLCDRI